MGEGVGIEESLKLVSGPESVNGVSPAMIRDEHLHHSALADEVIYDL